MTNGALMQKAMAQPLRSAFAAVAVLGLVTIQNTALADSVLAERFPETDVVTVADLPPLGSVPTFFVNLDPITMATYLRMDREDGRKHFDKSKPSLLDPYITKMQSMPVGGSSRNGFSQISPYVCITLVNATIPAWNDPIVGTPAAYNLPLNATRTCSPTYGTPMGRDSAQLLSRP